MTETLSISYGLAFLAGLVSFLSPCVLPIVPSYISFVTGLTLDELIGDSGASARRHSALHASLFILGFSIVFIALGASATAAGEVLRRSLPLIQQIGGIAITLFGLYALGWLRPSWLMGDRRVHLGRKPGGVVGSVLVGLAFGAGWAPCIGPVLASILLYASIEKTATQGMLLLTAYAVGLGIPFLAAALGFNWFIIGSRRMQRWMQPLQRVTGAFLVIMGLLLFTGRFAQLASFFAGFGQLINLEI